MQVEWRAVERTWDALEEDAREKVQLFEKRCLVEHISVQRAADVVETLGESSELIIFFWLAFVCLEDC